MSLKSIIEDRNTKAGYFFDIFIQSLIILSLISFSVETLPNLSPGFREVLSFVELITVVIFTLEYLLRIFVADSKLKYIFSFYGIIDLLAILPFYFMHGVDLRSVRIFRLIRLIRTFKLFRYNSAIKRLRSAVISIKSELILFLVVTLFLLYLSAVGIYYFEKDAQPEAFASVFHSLWWAVATLTTVGYGDIYPVTVGGKIFTSIVVFLGIGIVAVPTGLFASALTKIISKEKEQE